MKNNEKNLENTFRHTGRIARYTNIMGIKTVNIYEIEKYSDFFKFCSLKSV